MGDKVEILRPNTRGRAGYFSLKNATLDYSLKCAYGGYSRGMSRMSLFIIIVMLMLAMCLIGGAK